MGVVVRLEGGLGNQMFQYAFGKALSLHHGVNLYLDTKPFENWQPNPYNTKRLYELDIFNVDALLCTQKERGLFFPSTSLSSKVWHKLRAILGNYKKIYENNLGFDNSIIAQSTSKCYVVGHWQSVHYFEEIAPTLRRQFIPNLAICLRDLVLEAEIKAKRPVCVHVRRGDYVSNPKSTKVHGVLSMQYYKRAFELLQDLEGGSLTYYIFSDDPNWCSETFNWLRNSKIVYTPNPNHSCYDMYLMSLGMHFIIANSSFSWWAAWLANNKGKRVIAPFQWFATHTSEQLQMHPNDWITI